MRETYVLSLEESRIDFSNLKLVSLLTTVFPKKVCRAHSVGRLDAPVQGAFYYVEKITLSSKLRELY